MKLFKSICLAGLLPVAMLSIPTQAAAQQSGAALYKQRCAGCHGPDGAGQTAMGRSFKLKALGSPEVQQMSDAQLREVITKGKGKMPAYGNSLKPEQINELVTYIRSFKK